MKLTRISISPKELSSMPNEEKYFIVCAGHILNELICLKKIAKASIDSHDPHDDSDIEGFAQLTQAFCIINILAGKLFEANELIVKKYYGTMLSKNYNKYLSVEEISALRNIKVYFGKKNIIKSIRDNYSNHYASGETYNCIIKYINSVHNEYNEIFISNNFDNCYYLMSHMIFMPSSGIMMGDQKNISKDNIDDIFNNMVMIIKDVSKIISYFFTFFNGIIGIAFHKNGKPERKRISLRNSSIYKDVFVPYFH